ncbi:MAG: DUF89 family protein, partial [Candidatus Omnitrophica bacterium]|nr:DUF89 family protein [Candidatus Omnitrophota bacterium]
MERVTLLDERELPGIEELKGAKFVRHNLMNEIPIKYRNKYNVVISKDLINSYQIKPEEIDNIAERTDEVLMDGGIAIHSAVVPKIKGVQGVEDTTAKEIKKQLERMREWFDQNGYGTEIVIRPISGPIGLDLYILIAKASDKQVVSSKQKEAFSTSQKLNEMVKIYAEISPEEFSRTHPTSLTRRGMFIPTDVIIMAYILKKVKRKFRLKPGTKFLDLGAGDGKVVSTAYLLDFDATGVEYEPELVEISNKIEKELLNRKIIPFSDKPKVIQGNFLKEDFSGYDVFYYYGRGTDDFEALKRKLIDETKPGAVIITYAESERENLSPHFQLVMEFAPFIKVYKKMENKSKVKEKIDRLKAKLRFTLDNYIESLNRFNRIIVDKAIREVISGKPPEWMAREDYKPGYLLIKDVPKTGGDSKEGKIDQAKEHLYKATTDTAVRSRVEKLLDILKNHPQAEKLTLLQFEGVAHRLVKQFSGNPNAYKEDKKRLDNAYRKIYPFLRTEILKIKNDKERLHKAMLYAGIANLIDSSHPEALEKIIDDLSIEIDLSKDISAENLLKLVKGIYKKIEDEKLLISKDDFEQFVNRIESNPDGVIPYFLDNHGEIILDQLVIEQLLRSGYKVAVIGRGEVVRDDVTRDEAREILRQNECLKEYLDLGRLQVLTDGSYLLGADLTHSSDHPEFLKAWQNASAYIAKGAGNFHTLFGQKLSVPGLHIRMMKGSANAYEKLSEIRGRQIIQRSYYDLALIYQKAYEKIYKVEEILPSEMTKDFTKKGKEKGGNIGKKVLS